MRLLLVDDEPLALRRLEILLARRSDVDIVATASDGPKALKAIALHKPDVVLMDIEMPGLDGFEVLNAFDADEAPAIIFITAYDNYAVKAFDARAVDYLVKPVEDERLNEALTRVQDVLDSQTATSRVKDLEGALSKLRSDRVERQDLWIKDRGRSVRIDINDIQWVEAERDYVRLHSKERSWLIRDTMHHMMERLDADRFMRVHRSAIVNTDAVQMTRITASGGRVLRLENGAEVKVGRSFDSAVNERFQNAEDAHDRTAS